CSIRAYGTSTSASNLQSDVTITAVTCLVRYFQSQIIIVSIGGTLRPCRLHWITIATFTRWFSVSAGEGRCLLLLLRDLPVRQAVLSASHAAFPTTPLAIARKTKLVISVPKLHTEFASSIRFFRKRLSSRAASISDLRSHSS